MDTATYIPNPGIAVIKTFWTLLTSQHLNVGDWKLDFVCCTRSYISCVSLMMVFSLRAHLLVTTHPTTLSLLLEPILIFIHLFLILSLIGIIYIHLLCMHLHFMPLKTVCIIIMPHHYSFTVSMGTSPALAYVAIIHVFLVFWLNYYRKKNRPRPPRTDRRSPRRRWAPSSAPASLELMWWAASSNHKTIEC